MLQGILKNAEGKEGIDCGVVAEKMELINSRFGKSLSTVKGYEEGLLGRIRDWDRSVIAPG